MRGTKLLASEVSCLRFVSFWDPISPPRCVALTTSGPMLPVVVTTLPPKSHTAQGQFPQMAATGQVPHPDFLFLQSRSPLSLPPFWGHHSSNSPN